MKHKGYNNATSPNGNSTAQKFKYNGTELEESFGLNQYEMELRNYDPALGRWNAIDPITHHSMSTYNAFDNNPIFWADPSGADAVGGDGLTTEQWMEASRPGGGGFDAMRSYKKQNYMGELAANAAEREKKKKSTISPDGDPTFETDDNCPPGEKCDKDGNIIDRSTSDDTLAMINLIGGLTVGNVNHVNGLFIKNGLLYTKSGVYKLYKINGTLNGNQYLSGSKFMKNTNAIAKGAKFLSFLNVFSLTTNYGEAYYTGDTRHIVRGTISYLAGFAPGAGAVLSYKVDGINIEYFHLSHYLPSLYRDDIFNKPSDLADRVLEYALKKKD